MAAAAAEARSALEALATALASHSRGGAAQGRATLASSDSGSPASGTSEPSSSPEGAATAGSSVSGANAAEGVIAGAGSTGSLGDFVPEILPIILFLTTTPENLGLRGPAASALKVLSLCFCRLLPPRRLAAAVKAAVEEAEVDGPRIAEGGVEKAKDSARETASAAFVATALSRGLLAVASGTPLHMQSQVVLCALSSLAGVCLGGGASFPPVADAGGGEVAAMTEFAEASRVAASGMPLPVRLYHLAWPLVRGVLKTWPPLRQDATCAALAIAAVHAGRADSYHRAYRPFAANDVAAAGASTEIDFHELEATNNVEELAKVLSSDADGPTSSGRLQALDALLFAGVSSPLASPSPGAVLRLVAAGAGTTAAASILRNKPKLSLAVRKTLSAKVVADVDPSASNEAAIAAQARCRWTLSPAEFDVLLGERGLLSSDEDAQLAAIRAFGSALDPSIVAQGLDGKATSNDALGHLPSKGRRTIAALRKRGVGGVPQGQFYVVRLFMARYSDNATVRAAAEAVWSRQISLAQRRSGAGSTHTDSEDSSDDDEDDGDENDASIPGSGEQAFQRFGFEPFSFTGLPGTFAGPLLSLLSHRTACVRATAGRALAAGVQATPSAAVPTIVALFSLFENNTDEVAAEHAGATKIALMSRREQERQERERDLARAAVASSMGSFTAATTPTLRRLFEFLVHKALVDPSESVRAAAVASGARLVDAASGGDSGGRGSSRGEDDAELLKQMEAYLAETEQSMSDAESSGDERAYSRALHQREGVAVFLGRAAVAMRDDDPRLESVITSLIAALSTPSHAVQSAVADTLPNLIRSYVTNYLSCHLNCTSLTHPFLHHREISNLRYIG